MLIASWVNRIANTQKKGNALLGIPKFLGWIRMFVEIQKTAADLLLKLRSQVG